MTVTDPLTVTDIELVTVTVTAIVCVGASQTTAPVTAACVVVATAVVAKTAVALTRIVCDAASQTRPPVTPLACVVVVGIADPPETDTVPLIATVLGIVAVIVWVGANHTATPVTAACVVVMGELTLTRIV